MAGSFHPVETHIVQPSTTVLVPIKAEYMEPPIPEPIDPFPAPFEYTYPIQPPLDPESDYIVQMEAQIAKEFEFTERKLEETRQLIARVALANTRALRRLFEDCTHMDSNAKFIYLTGQSQDEIWTSYTSESEDIFIDIANGKIPCPDYLAKLGMYAEYSDEDEDGGEGDMEYGEDVSPLQNKRTREESEESDDDIDERPVKRPRVREAYRRALEEMRQEIPPMPPQADPGNKRKRPQISEDDQPAVIYGPEPQFVYVQPIIVKPRAPQEEAPAHGPAATEAVVAPEPAAADAPLARESTPVEASVPALIPAEAPASEFVPANDPSSPASLVSPPPYSTFSSYEEAVAAREIPWERLEGYAGASTAMEAPRAQYPVRTIDGMPPRYPSGFDLDAAMFDSSSPPPQPEVDDDVEMEDAPGRSWRDDVAAYASAKARQDAMDEDVFGPVLEPSPISQRNSAVGPIRSSPHRKLSWPSHAFEGSSPGRAMFEGTPYNISPSPASKRPSEYMQWGPPPDIMGRQPSGSSTRRILLGQQRYGYPRPTDQQVTDSDEDGMSDEDAPLPQLAFNALSPDSPESRIVPAFAPAPYASTSRLRPGTPRPGTPRPGTPRPASGPARNRSPRGVDENGRDPGRELDEIMISGTEAEFRKLKKTGIPRTYGFDSLHIPPAGMDVDVELPHTPPRWGMSSP